MPPSLSISNILQALYESSATIKTYVDCIADGNPAPYTLITKSTEHEKNERIVKRVKTALITAKKNEDKDMEDILSEFLDEAMILEEQLYEVMMFKDDAIVDGSRQTVKGEKISDLKAYANHKGYEFSVKIVNDSTK